MASLFKSTRNTRWLPTGDQRYIRSDAPLKLTENELQWLLENNVTTIVDLRSEAEVTEKPCLLRDLDEFEYYNLPVTGGDIIPKSSEQLHIIYAQMADEQMDNIIDRIMNAKSKVMYFCTAGKDRTGVVSALLLKRLGFDDEVIIDDYMESGDNLLDMLQAYAKADPEVDIEIITPRRENIKRLLENL